MEKDNEDQTLIRPEWVRGVETVIGERDLRERIKKAQEGDEKVVKAVEDRGKNVKRRGMGNRRWSSTEGRKNIRARKGT